MFRVRTIVWLCTLLLLVVLNVLIMRLASTGHERSENTADIVADVEKTWTTYIQNINASMRFNLALLKSRPEPRSSQMLMDMLDSKDHVMPNSIAMIWEGERQVLPTFPIDVQSLESLESHLKLDRKNSEKPIQLTYFGATAEHEAVIIATLIDAGTEMGQKRRGYLHYAYSVARFIKLLNFDSELSVQIFPSKSGLFGSIVGLRFLDLWGDAKELTPKDNGGRSLWPLWGDGVTWLREPLKAANRMLVFQEGTSKPTFVDFRSEKNWTVEYDRRATTQHLARLQFLILILMALLSAWVAWAMTRISKEHSRLEDVARLKVRLTSELGSEIERTQTIAHESVKNLKSAYRASTENTIEKTTEKLVATNNSKTQSSDRLLGGGTRGDTSGPKNPAEFEAKAGATTLKPTNAELNGFATHDISLTGQPVMEGQAAKVAQELPLRLQGGRLRERETKSDSNTRAVWDEASSTQTLLGEDRAYFALYQNFLEERLRCQQSIANIGYERFVRKVESSRNRIFEEYQTRDIEFQVYQKNGKAALRAIPQS